MVSVLVNNDYEMFYAILIISFVSFHILDTTYFLYILRGQYIRSKFV